MFNVIVADHVVRTLAEVGFHYGTVVFTNERRVRIGHSPRYRVTVTSMPAGQPAVRA